MKQNITPIRFLAIVALLAASATALAQQHPNVKKGFAVDQVYQSGEIDHVNVFNGNLVVQIPIGQRFQVGGPLSYNFALTYNSKVWDVETLLGSPKNIARVLPSQRSNAGLGWLLSFGRILYINNEANKSGALVYESPDGSEHRIYCTLHEDEFPQSDAACETPPLRVDKGMVQGYTRDGTYLRMRMLTDFALQVGRAAIEFPDGTTHIFEDDIASKSMRIVEMDDRFGNWVKFDYPNPLTWNVTDSDGRAHVVHFENATFSNPQTQTNYKTRLLNIQLAAWNSNVKAEYDFTYSDTTRVTRGCIPANFDLENLTGGEPRPPLLTQIKLPTAQQNAKYDVSYYFSGNSDCESGGIQRLTLPTGGTIDYTYQKYQLPAAGCTPDSVLNETGGVKTRILTDLARGNVKYTWTYLTAPGGVSELSCAPSLTYPLPVTIYPELRNTVIQPTGEKVTHFFSVWPKGPDNVPSPGGFLKQEYGLPFTHNTKQNGRFLSTSTTDTDGSGPKAMTYIAYEMDPKSNFDAFPPAAWDRNRRMNSIQTRYDDGKHADANYESFDGLGHYRTVKTDGDFAAGNVRTTVTDFNPGKHIPDPNDPNDRDPLSPSFFKPTIPHDAEWLLEAFDYRMVSEGTTTFKTEFCFDLVKTATHTPTGFLQARRTLKGLSAGGNDLLAVFDQVKGNVTSEKYFGGDKAATSSSGCASNGETPKYALFHEYDAGSLMRSQFVGSGFYSVDNDIDKNTGLVTRSRDSAGLLTNFTYDTLGRLTTITPQAGHGPQFVYAYGTDSTSATVDVTAFISGRQVDRKFVRFDSLGRLWLEFDQLPEANVWGVRAIEYDGQNRQTRLSERVKFTTADPFSARQNDVNPTDFTIFKYDYLGRPLVITQPDGHNVKHSYNGIGDATEVTSRVNADGTERLAQTKRIYDRQGRLFQVEENSASTSATATTGGKVTTQYTYDPAGKLLVVDMGAPNQRRSFEYDGRGLLTKETHPENGDTTYTGYDARGHAGARVNGGKTLTFEYDEAERLTKVTDQSGQTLKGFTFGRENDGTGRGKLLQAVRRNDLVSAGRIDVTENYEYNGAAGQMSKRKTKVQSVDAGGTARTIQQFEYGVNYDDLLLPMDVTMPVCTLVGCSMQGSSPTVTNSRTAGYLTAVNGFGSLTYQPSGMVESVVHATPQLPTDKYSTRFGQARPSKITFAACGNTAPVFLPGNTIVKPITTGSACGLLVTWPPAVICGGSGDVRYRVLRDGIDITGPSCLTSPKFVDQNNVVPGTPYIYTVVAEGPTVAGLQNPGRCQQGQTTQMPGVSGKIATCDPTPVLTVSPVIASVGVPATFRATLSSANGPVAGEELIFSLNNQEIGRPHTGADGTAILSHTVDLDPNTYTDAISVTYAGGVLPPVTKPVTATLKALCTIESYTIKPQALNVPPAGGSGFDVFVNTSSHCQWSPIANATPGDNPFLQVNPAARQTGKGTFSINIPGNNLPDARASTVLVEQQFVSVQQGGTGSGCSYRFVPELAYLPAETALVDAVMPVIATSGCHWTAAADPSAPWIHFNLQDPTSFSGTGNGQIRFSVDANLGKQRRAIVTLSDGATTAATGFVNQAAPPPAVCPITFVEDLRDGSVEKGQNIPLRVYTTGTELRYQWFINDRPVNGCEQCSTMTLGYFDQNYPAPGQSTTFQVRVYNSCGEALSTRVAWQNNATAGQCIVPFVEDSLRHPNGSPGDSLSPFPGALVTLSVLAFYSTSPLTYTWYRGLPGDRSSRIATNPDDGSQSSVTVSPFQTSFFWVELTDACGSQQSRSAAIFTTIPPARRRVVSHDFTGDGRSDIAWHNAATGQNEVWQMNGTIHASTIALSANQDSKAQLQSTGDFDANGNTDIVWRDPQTGHNEVWLMNRTQVSEVRPIEPRSDGHWNIGAVADYDNDNNDDIAWHNSATGENEIWFNSGTDHAGTWALPSNPDPQWGLYGTGDFNGDEKPDLFFHNRATGENQLWTMDDATRANILSTAVGLSGIHHLKVHTQSLPTMPDTNWLPALVADMDGDGRPDIVWRNTVTGENSVWIMSGTQVAQTVPIEPRTDLNWQIGGGGSGSSDSSGGNGTTSHGPTSLHIAVDPVASGDPTAVTAILTATGATVAQRQLVFTLSGTEVARLLTDATGSATAVIHTDARPAGTYPNAVSVRFEGDDAYDASSQSADLVITSAEASVAWKNPDAIVYGVPLSATQLNAAASVPGTFVYVPAAGAILNAGFQTLKVTFTPNDATIAAIMRTAVILVNKSPSSVSWTAPESIAYGTPLSDLQLNAASRLTGTFTYDPEPGTILPVGNAQTLHVMFEPDSANYAITTATTTIGVTKGSQTILWNDPASITTIQPLGPAQLNASVLPSGTTPIGQMTYAPPLGTVLAPGVHELSLTVAETPDYEAASATVDIIVTRVTPFVQWAQPAPVVYGTPLSGTQLNATADVQGTFTYDPPAGTILGAGTVQLYLLFTPSDARYEPVSASVSFQIAKAKQAITWSNPAPIVYGRLLSETQLNAQVQVAGPSFAGIVTYSPPSGTILQSGPAQTLTVTVDATVNYDAATASVVIDVLKATPVITWQQPAPIVYGTPLGAAQLGARADVGGSFDYTPPSGTILNVGTGQTLTVHFTPADTRNYNNGDATRTIDVAKAKQTIHWVPPAPIVYGTPLSSAQLNASVEVTGTSSAGVLTYTPSAGTLLQSGTAQALTVVVASTGNYEAATTSVVIDVLKATPVITWPQLAPIVYGTTLSSAQLNASVSVVGPAPAGALTYTPPAGTLLQAGSGQALTVVAAETPNYAAATARALLTVQKAKPVLTWANPAGIVYGTTLSNTQLNATANVPGSFVFTASAGTILNAGAGQALTVAFTPSDTNNYESGSATVTIDVAKAKQTLSWTLPSAIVYGTALSSTQLNASVKVAGPAPAGALIYAPAAGTLLDAGVGRALSVTAQATQNYDSATLAVSIDVNRAPLMLTVAAKSNLYGAAVPLLTGTLTGVVNGDNITPSYATTATQQSPVGGYPITATLVDPANRLVNYNVTITSSTLTAGPAPLQIAANAATKQYSDPLPPFSATFTGLVLGQTPAVLTGALTFTTPVTLTTAPGTYSLAVSGISSPNYAILFATGTLTVTAEDARIYYTGTLSAMPLTSKATTVAMTLSATIKDISATPEANGDTSKGDIRNATATFVDRGNGATLCTAPIGLVNAADLANLTVGTLTCTATVTVSTASTQQLRVGVVVGKNYVRDAASDDTVVTIAKFATASAQGNGKLALTKPAGAFGASGWDATFSLNVSTTSSGDDHEDSGNPKFQLDLKKHGEDDDHGHWYRITATSLKNLVMNNTAHTGTLDVAAVIEDRTGDNKIVLDSDAVVHVTFTAKSDNNNDNQGNNNNNSAGSIAITIWNKKGGLWFVSNFDGTKAVEQNFTDGELKLR